MLMSQKDTGKCVVSNRRFLMCSTLNLCKLRCTDYILPMPDYLNYPDVGVNMNEINGT